MGWLLSIYIAATVFGVGVTAIDLFGLIGDQDGGDDAGDADSGGDDAGGDLELDADFDSGGDADGDAGADGGDDQGDDSGDDHGSVAGHDRHHRRNPVLRFLSTLRNLVYFALGFGPTGWFALGTGESVTAALVWSSGVGVVVLAGARILRRVLRTELSSEIQESDLLMEKGEVTVTVSPNKLGRVRVSVGGVYVDRYARSESSKALPPGTIVRVVEVGEDSVIIESEEG